MISPFRADRRTYYRHACGSETPSWFRKGWIWINEFGLHCIAVYRLGVFARDVRKRHGIAGFFLQCLHRILHFGIRLVHHVEIHNITPIGAGCYFPHAGPLHIAAHEIGEHCLIMHNVTIGIGLNENGSGIPRIGHHVWIGTGAVVSGSITVGNHVTIGAGCVLSRSVPDGCLVGGNPGRIILRYFDNSRLLEPLSPTDFAPPPHPVTPDDETAP